MSQLKDSVSSDNRLMVGANGAVYELPGTYQGTLRSSANLYRAPSVPQLDGGQGQGCFAYATAPGGVGEGCFAYAPTPGGEGAGCFAYAAEGPVGVGSGCFAF
jgi:hypothetical protein